MFNVFFKYKYYTNNGGHIFKVGKYDVYILFGKSSDKYPQSEYEPWSFSKAFQKHTDVTNEQEFSEFMERSSYYNFRQLPSEKAALKYYTLNN